MANLDLSKYGITGVTEILHNPSYDVLFAEETKPSLEGFEKGQVTELGAVNVMTGIYTGRSPKDKFFVKNEASADSVWWTSEDYKNDNKPCTEEAWADLKAKAVKQLSGKRLFVVDTFCGANEATRMKVRFIMEVAWQAHFVTNMFIRPTAEELANYGEPDFVCFNASKAKVDMQFFTIFGNRICNRVIALKISILFRGVIRIIVYINRSWLLSNLGRKRA